MTESTGGNQMGIHTESATRGKVGGKMTRKQLEGLALAPNMPVVGISARMLRRIKAKVAK